MTHKPLKEIAHKSRFLRLILRHQPETIGLTLDKQGWADVAELLAKANAHGMALDFATLLEIVATSDKQRFAWNADQTQIRANQGHSIAVDLALTPCAPPAILYHGTAQPFVSAILQQGLLKGRRQHVHLSADYETAWQAGARHGVPAVFTVRAHAMVQEGFVFYCSANSVWLTEQVPSRYLDLVPSP